MILDMIAESSRIRVEKDKKKLSLGELKAQIYTAYGIRSFHSREAFAFEKALNPESSDNLVSKGKDVESTYNKTFKKRISVICEVKKASPSKGIIAECFPYLDIAKEYEEAGADAISVLTEPDYFLGENQYLSQISKQVSIPVLRKDFIVDEYQIYEAKVIGADAVLLICSLLDTVTLKKYLGICDELELSALVEAHTVEEVRSAIEAGARVLGVNNRNLKTFEVDLNHSIQLRGFVPEDILFVAESGIKTPEDMLRLQKAGVNAVLIGETLMRSPNKKEELYTLRRT